MSGFSRLISAAIQRIEKFAKTDVRYMMRGGFWLSLAKAVSMLASIVIATAMANLIPLEVFGTYKFVLSGAGIIGAFALTAVGTAIIQAVARGYDGALREGVRAYLKWSAGMVVISIGVATYYFVNGNATLGAAFLLVAVANPFLTAFSFFSQFLSGKRDFRTQSIYDSAADVFPALCLVAALFNTQNPLILVATYFLSGIGINLVLYYSTLRKYRPSDRTDAETIPYTKHLSLMAAVVKIGENIDKILVFHYLGAAQLAIYAFAQTPISQLKLLNEIPSRLALPKLSERSYSELKESLPRKVFFLVLIMALVVMVYAFIAPYVFGILFPKYAESIIYTQLLAISLIFAPGSIFGDALTAHMRKRELYVSQTILPTVKIGLFLVLLPLYGILGAIAAIIASQCIMFIVYAYLFWRSTPPTTAVASIDR